MAVPQVGTKAGRADEACPPTVMPSSMPSARSAPPSVWDSAPPATATAARSRDHAARVIWDEHYAHLAGWCAAMVGDADAAHDIASEAFVRLLSRWFSVRDPRGFLYVTATNLVRDRWRRQQRDRNLNQRLQCTTTTTAPSVDTGLRDLVERLPERMRTPVLLHYYADLPVADVARAVHRPEGTIKRSLSDARALLHNWLEDDR